MLEHEPPREWEEDIPEWSRIALRRIGLRHSLHLTRPVSWTSGSEPNVFISRAESHDVGGEGARSGGSKEGGVEGSSSQEKGEAGGEGLGLSLRVMAALQTAAFGGR